MQNTSGIITGPIEMFINNIRVIYRKCIDIFKGMKKLFWNLKF